MRQPPIHAGDGQHGGSVPSLQRRPARQYQPCVDLGRKMHHNTRLKKGCSWQLTPSSQRHVAGHYSVSHQHTSQGKRDKKNQEPGRQERTRSGAEAGTPPHTFSFCGEYAHPLSAARSPTPLFVSPLPPNYPPPSSSLLFLP